MSDPPTTYPRMDSNVHGIIYNIIPDYSNHTVIGDGPKIDMLFNYMREHYCKSSQIRDRSSSRGGWIINPLPHNGLFCTVLCKWHYFLQWGHDEGQQHIFRYIFVFHFESQCSAVIRQSSSYIILYIIYKWSTYGFFTYKRNGSL